MVLGIVGGGALSGRAAADEAAPKTFRVSQFEFARPEKWDWVKPASEMRKAQLAAKIVAGKEAAEVVFFHFGPGNAGGKQANVERWFRQFQEGKEKAKARSEDVKVGAHVVTYVQAEGTYLSGMPGRPQTPMADFALLGAIVDGSEGSVFIKMTGPKAVVESATADFKRMVEGAMK